MKARLGKFLVAAAAAYVVGGTTAGLAANDHLKCYKAKEVAGPGKVQYSATLVSGIGLNTESGCVIKGPPKLVCAPVTKTAVVPPPPGGGPTGATHRFFCYKVRCPKGPAQTVGGSDQFGNHTFAVKAPKQVCLPASPGGAFLDDPSSY